MHPPAWNRKHRARSPGHNHLPIAVKMNRETPAGNWPVLCDLKPSGKYVITELHAAGEGDFTRAALLVDAREGLQLEKLPPLLRHLKKDHPITLVFIEAGEDALLRRYSETRRPHPLGRNFSRISPSTRPSSMSTSCAISSPNVSEIPTIAR